MAHSENPIVLYIGPATFAAEITEIIKTQPHWGLYLARQPLETAGVISGRGITVGLVRLDGAQQAYSLDAIKALVTQAPVISWIALIRAEDLQDSAVARLIADWFCGFHLLPINPARLIPAISDAHDMDALRHRMFSDEDEPFDGGEMVGSSSVMMDLFAAIRKVAQSSAPVLIAGESGTGKELVARAIHERSRAAKGPFVPINCGGIPPTLIESELYGYERGAFTGAYKRKKGLIESGANGTIFLDEIGELDPSGQASLLRFLQEKTILRVGGSGPLPIETRVLAATNVDIAAAVKAGHFREDLFFRIGVLQIEVPPLRERGGDAELLARYYLRVFAHEEGRKITGFSKDALPALRSYQWPGNVRELVNRTRRALVMSSGGEISAADLGLAVPNEISKALSLERIRRVAEIEGIQRALAQSDYNWSKAAMLLKVSRGTLYRLAERHGVSSHRTSEQDLPEAPTGLKN